MAAALSHGTAPAARNRYVVAVPLSCAWVDRLNVTKAASTSAATKTMLMSLPAVSRKMVHV